VQQPAAAGLQEHLLLPHNSDDDLAPPTHRVAPTAAAVAVLQGFAAVMGAAKAWTKLLSYQLDRLGPLHTFDFSEFEPAAVLDDLTDG
jgi:hypothetical protein